MSDLLDKYTEPELMLVEISRHIKDETMGVVGVGLGQMPALLAQKTDAPNITLAYEGGQIGPTVMGGTPLAIDSSFLQGDAGCYTDLLHTLGWLTAAPQDHSTKTGLRTDWTLLGTGQVDKYGNLNSTVIGDYYNPKVRFPGSGGAHDLATGANEVFIVTRHDTESLVKELDYWTSPGYGKDGKLRDNIYYPGGGPSYIFTTKATLIPNEDNEFILKRVQPHSSVEEVKENTGWDLKVDDDVEKIKEPPEEWIRIIREELDPQRIIVGKP